MLCPTRLEPRLSLLPRIESPPQRRAKPAFRNRFDRFRDRTHIITLLTTSEGLIKGNKAYHTTPRAHLLLKVHILNNLWQSPTIISENIIPEDITSLDIESIDFNNKDLLKSLILKLLDTIEQLAQTNHQQYEEI